MTAETRNDTSEATTRSLRRQDDNGGALQRLGCGCRCGKGFADDGAYAGAEEFDGVHESVVTEGGDAHLEADAGDAAESFVHLEELGGYGFGVADHECSAGAAEGFELAAGDGRPAALFAYLGEGVGIAGEEVVCGLLVGVGDVAEGVDADFELLGCVAGALAGFAVEVDEGAEAVGLAADDGDHERQAECAGADEGLGGASDA